MSRSRAIQFTLATEDNTSRLACRLAPLLKPGDVILLEGPIGAGKTHFARSLILALLPQPEDVPSPSFTLVQTYRAPHFEIWHCDLYRLTSPDDVFELGLEEAMETALCLIEWPDRLAGAAPQSSLMISLRASEGGQGHTARFSASDPRWYPVLEALNA